MLNKYQRTLVEFRRKINSDLLFVLAGANNIQVVTIYKKKTRLMVTVIVQSLSIASEMLAEERRVI